MKHQSIYNRLRRIEGQVRGIEEMIAKEKSDLEVIIQLQAVKSSVASSIIELSKSIIESEGSDKTAVIQKILKIVI